MREFVVVILVLLVGLAGIGLVATSDDLARRFADAEAAQRYGLPASLTSQGKYVPSWNKLAFPGDRASYSVAGESVRFRYWPLGPSDAPVTAPDWMDAGVMPLVDPEDPAWFIRHGEMGNRKPGTYAAICNFYVNGRYTRTGPCTANTVNARIDFAIADIPELVGKHLALAVRTETGDRMVRWRVSSPHQLPWEQRRERYQLYLMIAGGSLLAVAAFAMWRSDLL